MPRIESHRYGKSRVRLLAVRRRGEIHDVRELAVTVLAEGAFEASYTSADNQSVLPTDTMKNTVYAFAKQHPIERLESFGLVLARHLTTSHDPISRAIVELEEHAWARVMTKGRDGLRPHPHAFTRSGPEVATARIVRDREREEVVSGLRGLRVMKSAGSGFEGFARDPYTTLVETKDRILATELNAEWTWSEAPSDWAVENSGIRGALLEAFASEYSPSVQHTLHAMAKAALERCERVQRIHLTLPNLHCVPVDLSPFGLENANEIFVPLDEPQGVVEATVARE